MVMTGPASSPAISAASASISFHDPSREFSGMNAEVRLITSFGLKQYQYVAGMRSPRS